MTSRELRIKALAALAEANQNYRLALNLMSLSDQAEDLARTIDRSLTDHVREGEAYSPAVIPGDHVYAMLPGDLPIVLRVVYDEDIDERVRRAEANAEGVPERPIEPWEGGDE